MRARPPSLAPPIYFPSLPQDLLDEILQLTLCKYRGRPHWALSTNRMLFTSERCGSVVQKFGGELMGRFMERRLRYDPDDLFLNPAFVGIISEAEPERYPGRHACMGDEGMMISNILFASQACPCTLSIEIDCRIKHASWRPLGRATIP